MDIKVKERERKPQETQKLLNKVEVTVKTYPDLQPYGCLNSGRCL